MNRELNNLADWINYNKLHVNCNDAKYINLYRTSHQKNFMKISP